MEITLPMIVAAGGMGERRGGPGTAVVDWGRGGPPEPAIRRADIRDVTDEICKLCKTYNYRK